MNRTTTCLFMHKSTGRENEIKTGVITGEINQDQSMWLKCPKN